MTEYVFPEQRLFPINTPNDIKIAIEAFKLFEDELSYSDFVERLIQIARRRGSSYLNALPSKVKKICGVKKENRPEYDSYAKTSHKKKSRFIPKRRDDEDSDFD